MRFSDPEGYAGPEDEDRSGASMRMVAAALIALSVSGLLCWVLIERGAGLLQIFFGVWLAGNLVFLGTLVAAPRIARMMGRGSDAEVALRAEYRRVAADKRRNPSPGSPSVRDGDERNADQLESPNRRPATRANKTRR